MTRISSSTLFNITDKIDYLIDNLINGIYCSNTYEKLPVQNNGYRVPMACFCDIPLSLIKEHFDWYGRYGIGIKRSYAREHGVKPVWYVTSENNYVRNLIKQKEFSDYERKYILPYLKQFIGYQFYTKENRKKRKKYYDEREWRFIPNNSLVESFFGIKEQKEEKELEKSTKRMTLDLNQVEYIIIEKSSDLESMLKNLKVICKGSTQYENMVSKIITSRQIDRDF